MGEFTRLNEKAPIALSDYAQFWGTPCNRGMASLWTVTKLETRPMEVSWRQVSLFSNLAKPLISCCRISEMAHSLISVARSSVQSRHIALLTDRADVIASCNPPVTLLRR
jgi:hypothetical protein